VTADWRHGSTDRLERDLQVGAVSSRGRHLRAQSAGAPRSPTATLGPILADLKAFLDATLAKLEKQNCVLRAALPISTQQRFVRVGAPPKINRVCGGRVGQGGVQAGVSATSVGSPRFSAAKRIS
jgi:hypothetical protein